MLKQNCESHFMTRGFAFGKRLMHICTNEWLYQPWFYIRMQYSFMTAETEYHIENSSILLLFLCQKQYIIVIWQYCYILIQLTLL